MEESFGIDSAHSTSGMEDQPLDDEVADGGGADGGGATPGVDYGCCKVEVFDPRQHGKGRSRYTSYCIIARDAEGKPQAAVRRRYSAFQWLYRHLHEERPGAIVPPIPHQKAMNAEKRFSEEVISERRRQGELWINAIVGHPELRGAPCLLAFLGADDTIFATAREKEREEKGEGGGDDSDDDGEHEEDHGDNDQEEQDEDGTEAAAEGSGGEDSRAAAKSALAKAEAAKRRVRSRSPLPSPVGRERFYNIRKLATKFSTKITMASAGVQLEKAADEYTFEQLEEWAATADASVREVAKQAATLMKLHRERGRIYDAIGTTAGRAAKLTFPLCSDDGSKQDATQISAVFLTASELALSFPAMENQRADRLEDRFEAPVEALLDELKMFRGALHQRREVQVDYTNKLHRIEVKTLHLQQVRAAPMQRAVNKAQQEERLRDAEKQLEDAKRASSNRKEDFELCGERVKREAERFRVRFRDMFRETVRSLAEAQMEFNAKSTEKWGELEGSMEYMEVVGGKDVQDLQHQMTDISEEEEQDNLREMASF